MKTIVYGAESDLGINIEGAALGPVQLKNDIKSFYQDEIIELKTDPSIIKSKNLSDRKKNIFEIEKFNTDLYNSLVETKKDDNNFVIVMGGDETVSIPSIMSDVETHKEIGLIYFTGSPLFDTIETTQNGNMQDLTISAVTGYKSKELAYYQKGNVQVARTVIIGCRNLTDSVKDNLKYAGITYYTTEDIKERGIEEILNEAFIKASTKTKGIHISFSLSLIDPEYAPGVSEPRFDGLDESISTTIHQELANRMENIISYDLVGFNPLRDIERKTEQIAVNILAQMITAANNKDKFGKVERKY